MILMIISCHHTKAGDEDEEPDEQRVGRERLLLKLDRDRFTGRFVVEFKKF